MAEYLLGKPWPLPWPDAAQSSTHDLIQSVWISDTRRRVHIAKWHRDEHPNKPKLELPDGYAPEPGSPTGEIFNAEVAADRRPEPRMPYADD